MRDYQVGQQSQQNQQISQQQPETGLGAIDRELALVNERLQKDLAMLGDALDRITGPTPGMIQQTQAPHAVPSGMLEGIRLRVAETTSMLDILGELIGRASTLA